MCKAKRFDYRVTTILEIEEILSASNVTPPVIDGGLMGATSLAFFPAQPRFILGQVRFRPPHAGGDFGRFFGGNLRADFF